MNKPPQLQQPWYTKSIIHHCYLLTCVLFLTIVNFTPQADILTFTVFVIHLSLLSWKLLHNESFMRILFKVKLVERSEVVQLGEVQKEMEEKKNVWRRGNMKLFEISREISRTPKQILREALNPFKRDEESPGRIEDQRKDRQPANEYQSKNAFIKHLNQKNQPSNQLWNRNKRAYGSLDKPTTFQFKSNNISYYSNFKSPSTQRSYYMNPSSLKKSPIYTSPNIENKNQFPVFQYDPNAFEMNKPGQNPLRKHAQESAIRRKIEPFEREFFRLKIGRELAVDMIIFVRKYFEQRMVDYKTNEKRNFEKLRGLVEKYSESKSSFANYEDITNAAKELISTHYKKKKYGYHTESESSGKILKEIGAAMEAIYFPGLIDMESKTDVITFYKEEIERCIFPGLKLYLIISDCQYKTPNCNNSINTVYYVTPRHFCYCHQNQINHPFNIDETFLFVILANKNKYKPSDIVKELEGLRMARNDLQY